MKKETWQWTAQGRMRGEARFTTWELRTESGGCVRAGAMRLFAWLAHRHQPHVVGLPDPCSPRRPFLATPGPQGQG